MVLVFAAALVTARFDIPDTDNDVAQIAAAAQTDTQIPIFADGREHFVAHRGYSGYAPENSIAAFTLAGRTGFWGIETDISETSDGRFVCMHDETIDRTTDGEGTVGDYTFDALMQFSIDSGNYLSSTENRQIPTLEEYLDICSEYGCVPIVEIKTIQNYDAFTEVIRNHNLLQRCVITGPIDAIKKIREIDSEVYVMVIGYDPEPFTKNLTDISQIKNNRGVLFNYPQIDKSVVDMIHGQNILCAVWSIDDREIAKEYDDYGVDFIVTNEIPATLNGMVNTNE